MELANSTGSVSFILASAIGGALLSVCSLCATNNNVHDNGVCRVSRFSRICIRGGKGQIVNGIIAAILSLTAKRAPTGFWPF